MMIHFVLGQAGSGKSTFITRHFPKEDNILFNVGEILRGAFSCMKNKQESKNVWSFANPLVYSMFKHCCKVSRDQDIPLVSDGMPRNSSQLMFAHRYLTDFSHKIDVTVNIHALHISRSEQIERIRERNGDIDEYQLDRIKQSRRDLEGVMNALNPLVESSPKHKIRYKIKWYKQEDGQFVLDREY